MRRLTSSSWVLVAAPVFTHLSTLLLTAALGFAQTTPGVVPYSSYKFHQSDAVSNADLNRIITAPVRAKAGLIPFQANLVMNNTVTLGYTPLVNSYFALRVVGT